MTAIGVPALAARTAHACREQRSGSTGRSLAARTAFLCSSVGVQRFQPGHNSASAEQPVLAAELRSRDVRVVTGVDVTSIRSRNGGLAVAGSGFEGTADVVIVANGVRPAAALGLSAGLMVGTHGALCVNRQMETGVHDVYAAGDCVETWHRVLNAYVYLPLGTTAHEQGRVAGENIVGGSREYAGSVGTQAVKVFNLVAARTGLRDDEARRGDSTRSRWNSLSQTTRRTTQGRTSSRSA